MNWVLAASIQRRKNEPFSESARQWAQNNYRPLGTSGSLSTRVKEFTVQSPVKALECLVSQTQAQYQALGLFGIQHCEKDAWSEDLEGKVLILSPDSLKECYWEPKNQLWLPMPVSSGKCRVPIWERCPYDGHSGTGESRGHAPHE